MSSRKPLKVAVLGPKGQCGSCVVDELLSRGHSTVGISRSPPAKWPARGDYSSIAIDFADKKKLTEALSDGFDAIVCAYGPPIADLTKTYLLCVETQSRIKSAVLASTHAGPFIIIGGAGSLHCKNGEFFADEPDFCYGAWYKWPDAHLDYMRSRAYDHKAYGFSRFIGLFKWARSNVEQPGWFSWLGRPFAKLFLGQARKFLTSPQTLSLVLGSRVALHLWEGVKGKSWSFLSPPWLLRDKGIRTGRYKVHVDGPDTPDYQGIRDGIYNEDMAVAIVDEVENKKLIHQHWTCTGPIDLKEW